MALSCKQCLFEERLIKFQGKSLWNIEQRCNQRGSMGTNDPLPLCPKVPFSVDHISSYMTLQYKTTINLIHLIKFDSLVQVF